MNHCLLVVAAVIQMYNQLKKWINTNLNQNKFKTNFNIFHV